MVSLVVILFTVAKVVETATVNVLFPGHVFCDVCIHLYYASYAGVFCARCPLCGENFCEVDFRPVHVPESDETTTALRLRAQIKGLEAQNAQMRGQLDRQDMVVRVLMDENNNLRARLHQHRIGVLNQNPVFVMGSARDLRNGTRMSQIQAGLARLRAERRLGEVLNPNRNATNNAGTQTQTTVSVKKESSEATHGPNPASLRQCKNSSV